MTTELTTAGPAPGRAGPTTDARRRLTRARRARVNAVAGKLARLVVVIFLVTTATFFMLELIPGDPVAAIVGPDAPRTRYLEVRSQLGLDKPVIERYVGWMGGLVTGNLGRSVVPPALDVADMIASRLPVTLELAFLAILMSLAIAVPAALVASARAQGAFDRTANGVAFALVSVPSFLAALLLLFLLVFNPQLARWSAAGGLLALVAWLTWRAVSQSRRYAVGQGRGRRLAIGLALAAVVLAAGGLLIAFWPTFPRQGFVRLGSPGGLAANLRSAFLPALTLALTEAAIFMRLLRGDLGTILQEDYILSAKAKGMPTWRIMLQHALRPASFSLVTVAGVALGRLIGGTVIVETVFNLPGMGTMIVQAIQVKDLPVVQGGVLVVAVFYVAVSAVIDLTYAYLDPRIRRG